MKKILLSMTALALAGSISAQDSGFSAGIDLAMPMGGLGDVFSFGVGPMVSYEKEAGEMGLLGGSIAYTIMFPKDDFIKGGAIIPIQAHYRHFFNDIREGLFVGAMAGYGILSVKTEDFSAGGFTIEGSSTSSAGFALAPMVGYYLTERIDIGLRYQIILVSADGDATIESGESNSANNYLGLRAGFSF